MRTMLTVLPAGSDVSRVSRDHGPLEAVTTVTSRRPRAVVPMWQHGAQGRTTDAYRNGPRPTVTAVRKPGRFKVVRNPPQVRRDYILESVFANASEND
jgi:hypothetical protein